MLRRDFDNEQTKKNINNDYCEKRFYDKQVKKISIMIVTKKQAKKNINNDYDKKVRKECR